METTTVSSAQSIDLRLRPVILQSLRIDDIPGFPLRVRDKRDFVTVLFHRTLNVQQFRLLFILGRFLRFSVREDRNPGMKPGGNA
jgi:hypothetical protein